MSIPAIAIRLDSYSAEPLVRKEARRRLILDFQERAPKLPHEEIIYCLDNNNLFVHELDQKDLSAFLVFVSTHYAEHELQPWLEQKLFWALNDHAFEQAAVIAKFSKEKIFLEITDYIGIFTEDLVIFLESHTSIIGIKPFIQIEWTNNKAGVEGFARLVKLVDPEAMKDFISRRSPEGRDYPPLAMLLQEGKMEGYFDNKTRELIIARSYVYSLSSAFSENQTALILQDMEPERLLYLLAVEAKQPDDTSDFLRALSNTAAWVKSKLKA